VSFNIKFIVKPDKTIDPESVVITGTPPEVPVMVWGHVDATQTQVGVKVGDLTAMASETDPGNIPLT